MPFETSTEAALGALERLRTNFLSAVAATVGELGRLLVQDHDSEQARGQRAAATLGAFAAGHFDAQRFAALISDRPVLPPAALEAIGRARAVLSAIVTGGPEQFVVKVGVGEDISAAVGLALSRLGRAFGAARVAAMGRAGGYRSSEHAPLLEGLPFARWSRAERGLAPPLVVRVEGSCLRVAGLADFLDGAVKLAILAPEAVGPAPLALLVTPRVFVAQGHAPDLLERLCSSPSPGVAAILAEGSSRFVHDPAGGERLADRLTVEHFPEISPNDARSKNDFRAAEERAQLALLLAATSGTSPNGSGGRSESAQGDPADLLAAWLLRQANLPPSAEPSTGVA